MMPIAFICHSRASVIKAWAYNDIRCGTEVLPDGVKVHYEFCGPIIPPEHLYYMIGFYASTLIIAVVLVFLFLKTLR